MRFLYHGLRGWFAARNRAPTKELQKQLTPHIFHSRAGLLDIDVNLHLNNASLILATEFARWNFIAGTDLAGAALNKKWSFMVGSQAVRYRHEISAFRKYQVKTELVAADESWLWLRHTVHSGGRCCAHVLARVIIKEGRATVPAKEILRLVGVDANFVPNPETSSEVAGFLIWDSDAAIQMKNNTI